MGLKATTTAFLGLLFVSSFEGGVGVMMKEQMCGETIAANGETQVMEGATTIGSVAELENNMTYKPPKDMQDWCRDGTAYKPCRIGAETKGVLPEKDMKALMEDPAILGIAYGPAFQGKGNVKAGDQIVAWRYLADKKLVVMYYPKTTCRDLVVSGKAAKQQGKEACGDGRGNLAGALTCSACPSCTMSWGACTLNEKKKKPVGSTIDLGSMAAPGKIVEIDSGYKIEIQGSPGCYFDHAWVNSISLYKGADATPKCYTAKGSECSCTGGK